MATLKNTTINDTGFVALPPGTTGQRPATPALGMMRYNTTLNVLEQYTADGWQGIEAPPVVTTFSGIINENTNSTITITGSNFKSGSVVNIEGAAVGGVSRALVTTFVNSTSLTAATNATSVNYTGAEAFDIKVTNPSGLSAVLQNAGTIDRDPTWTTAAGNIGTTYDLDRATKTYTLVATDPDGSSVTYSIASGSLPAGMSLNSSTGVISGTANAVGSDTTSTFTARVTSATQTVDRSFNIIIKAPIVASYTSTGTTTFSVPSGLQTVRVLLQAGGGGGGRYGAGGAGGQVEVPAFPVTPGGSLTLTVGAGGPTGANDGSTSGSAGGNSVFGSLTALGGGGAKYHGAQGGPADLQPVSNGGCGAGGDSNPGSAPNASAGTGQQPSQPGQSGSSGFGNPGSAGGNFLASSTTNAQHYVGGGGGGTAAAGAPFTQAGDGAAGAGGPGRASDITGSSVNRGGGGGGSFYAPQNNNRGGGGGGGGGGGAFNLNLQGTSGSESGGTNTGGGGGGGGAGSGGPGIVILKY